MPFPTNWAHGWHGRVLAVLVLCVWRGLYEVSTCLFFALVVWQAHIAHGIALVVRQAHVAHGIALVVRQAHVTHGIVLVLRQAHVAHVIAHVVTKHLRWNLAQEKKCQYENNKHSFLHKVSPQSGGTITFLIRIIRDNSHSEIAIFSNPLHVKNKGSTSLLSHIAGDML